MIISFSMNGKQDSGNNTINFISVHILIFHLVVNFVRSKTLRSALWHCPILLIAIRLLKIITEVTKPENGENQISLSSLSLLLSFFFPSSTRALHAEVAWSRKSVNRYVLSTRYKVVRYCTEKLTGNASQEKAC